MKQLFIMLMCFASSFTANAQQTGNEIFQQYKGKKGYTSIQISPYAFELMSDVLNEDEKEFKEAIDMIDEIKIVVADDSPTQASSFYHTLQQNFNQTENVKPLMSLNGADEEQLNFYYRSVSRQIKDFILLIGEPTTSMMILIQGDNINLKKLRNLADGTDIDGFDQLKKIQ